MKSHALLLLLLSLFLTMCGSRSDSQDNRIKVVFDTDANNELDDQHALAYLLFNADVFDVKGVTVNATHSGGNIDKQYAEAERIMKLTGADGKMPLLKGADGRFINIQSSVGEGSYDGSDAVNFIIEQANATKGEKLVVLAVGKLTTVALALVKDPSLAEKIRLVWLGSNYPKPGEYNQDNDTVAMNYLLNTNTPFEMVTVRYGEDSGTSAVIASQDEINQKMPGKGPKAATPVEGRHGGKYTTFGDYSVSLFEHIHFHDSTKTRSLFDMVAVAVLKNESWGEKRTIPAPILINNEWVDRPNNPRTITIWENFNKEAIMRDFYETMDEPVLVK